MEIVLVANLSKNDLLSLGPLKREEVRRLDMLRSYKVEQYFSNS